MRGDPVPKLFADIERFSFPDGGTRPGICLGILAAAFARLE
jgi:hypothetical protein